MSAVTQHNNNHLLGENDGGSCYHSASSSLCPHDVWTPSGCWRLISVLLFLFFIPMPFRMKSLSCEAAWLKTSSPPSSVAHPHRTPRLWVQQPGDPVPSDTWPHTRKVERCSLSAGLIIPSWHGHYSVLWMACQSPMVASQLVMSRGSLLAGFWHSSAGWETLEADYNL